MTHATIHYFISIGNDKARKKFSHSCFCTIQKSRQKINLRKYADKFVIFTGSQYLNLVVFNLFPWCKSRLCCNTTLSFENFIFWEKYTSVQKIWLVIMKHFIFRQAFEWSFCYESFFHINWIQTTKFGRQVYLQIFISSRN